MFSQIASVWSSQGVLLEGIEYIGFPDRRNPVSPREEKKDFGPVFDQASAKLELSQQALKAIEAAADSEQAPEAGRQEPSEAAHLAPTRLSEDERKAVEKLKERDLEVRRHEQSHVAGAGGHAVGGAHYEYKVGPDGKSYAVGGHVAIDVSPVSGNPEATLQKAMTVQRAAMAPAEPSGADQAVAAAAAGMAREAAKELADKRAGKSEEAAAGSAARRNPYAQASSGTGGRINAYA